MCGHRRAGDRQDRTQRTYTPSQDRNENFWHRRESNPGRRGGWQSLYRPRNGDGILTKLNLTDYNLKVQYMKIMTVDGFFFHRNLPVTYENFRIYVVPVLLNMY